MTERSRELFDAVIEDPSNREASGELEALLREQERWDELNQLYIHLAEHELEDIAARAAYLQRAAAVARDELEDLAQAVQLYSASLEGEALEADVLMATLAEMRRLLLVLGEWESYVEVATAEQERIQEPQARAALIFQVGQILDERVGDRARALEYYEAAYQTDPAQLDAVAAARRIHRDVDNLEMVVQLMQYELENAPDDARRLSVLTEMANLYMVDLGEHEAAIPLLQEIVRLDPDNADARARLDALGGGDGEDSPESTVETTVEATAEEPEPVPEPPVAKPAPARAAPVAEASDDDDEDEDEKLDRLSSLELEALARRASGAKAHDLYARAAAATGGGDGEEFVRLYLAAVEADPAEVEVYWAAGRSLEGADEVKNAVAEGLDALAEAGGDAVAAHRLVFGAAHLGEERTVDYKLREMAKKSDDPAVVRWQTVRLVEAGKWRNVQQVFAQEAGGKPAEARVVALRQMARLAERRLGDQEKAADFWRQVHQADKDDKAARRALLRLYEALGKEKELVDILRVIVDDIPEGQTQKKLDGLRRLAALVGEQPRQDAQVVQIYAEILALDPEDDEAPALLIEKYEAMRRWPDLIGVLETQFERAEGQAKIDYGVQIAELYLGRLRNQAEAIKAFEAVLELDAENRAALEALDGMYEKRRDWDNLIATRQRIADLADDIETRLAGYKALAEYADKKIRRPNIVQALWEKVREIAPEDVDALRALVGAYEQGKNFDELVETIDILVDLVDDTKEQVDLLQRSGSALQDRMDDKARAVPVWQRLLELDPNNRRAGDSLKKALVELGDWDALETFYADQRNGWAELVRLLEGQVGVQKEDEVKIDLLFRAARIYEEHLDQQDRAVRALERVLQTEPGNVEAARRLEPIYTGNDDHRKLVGVLEVLLEHEAEPDQRRVLMMRSAELAEQHMRNTEGAFEWVRKVIAEHPADAHARDELMRLGEATGAWEAVHADLAEALDRVPEMAPADVDPGEAQLAILLGLGRILDRQMGAHDEALARYHQALELDPDNREALDAVEQLYTRSMSWHELLGVLDRKLALAEETEERKELHRKQGLIYENQLEDALSAIERYRNVVDEDPADRDALESLRRLYEASEQFDELHRVLGRLRQMALDDEDAEHAVSLQMVMAILELHHLDQVPQAIETFRGILADDQGHDGARQALEGLLEDPQYRGEVGGILEPIYRDAGAWEPLATVLEIQLEDTFEADRRIELLERIGTMHVERTSDIERAFDAFARMFREAPANETAIEQLARLAEVADGWDVLAELMEQVLPEVAEEALARALLARLADIYENRLDNAEMAIDAHRRTLDLEPEERPAIEALDRLYTRTEQWIELLSIYRRKLELTEEPDAREALQFQIANLLEAMLGEPREAIAVYNEIIDVAPENGRALEALDRLYGQEEMWSELADILGRRLGLTEDSGAQVALRVRLGEVRETKLSNFDLAIETYRDILEVDPDNGAAIGALERLSEDPAFRPAIADILEPIYTRQDDWQKLIHAYEIQREFSPDEARKVELLHKIADLHQTRGADAVSAFTSYARAFQVDPSHEETIGHLHRIAGALDLWADLAAVYEQQVPEILDPEIATAVHKRVAEVQLRQLGDYDGAREHYEAAYQADDTDMAVIEALEEIYRTSELWSELVATLHRKAELTEDVGPKKGLYFQIAGLNEEMLGDPFRAVEALRTVRDLDPVDGQALDELERLFNGMEQWEDLLEVLHRKAELTEDVDTKKRIYYAIGASCEMQLEDPLRAVDTYAAVLEWDADDLEALGSLERLYGKLEYWEDLQKVLARQAELVPDEQKLDIRFRVAQLHEIHLLDVETAIEGYRGILAEQPEHEASIQALEGLIRQDREPRMAAEVLEPVLTKAGNWNRMVEVWRALLEVTMDLEVRTGLRMRIGQAFEDMLADSEGAFAAYGDAFKEDPTHEAALTALERVAQNAEMWGPFVELIEGQLMAIPSEYVARDLYLRVARALDEELGDAPGSIQRYVRVMEIDPDHEGAILALDRLYQKVGAWPELADILQLRVERAEDADRVPLLLRLGALFETALERISEAITAYKDVLDIEPEQTEAVVALERMFEAGHEQPVIGEVLEPIYLSNERWPELHNLLQALLAHLMPGEERMRSMHRLAELSQVHLDNTEQAFLWYGEAFKEVPEDEHSRRELQRLAEQIGAWENLVAIYTEGLENTQDFELIRTSCHDMADIYRQRLSNDEMAESMYQHVLTQIDPTDAKALKGLDVLFEEQGRWPDLIDILRREVEVTYDEPELITLMYRLGQLYERQAELEAAVEEYNGILAREPNHPEALARLEQIYVVQENWAPLYEVYARQAENAEDDMDRARILASQANLAGQFLDRTFDAVDLWTQVLELRGEDAEALMALEGLYQVQESWRELVDVCERQVNLLENDQSREKQLYAKLGRVWGDYLERERNALENWHKVLELDPDDEDALWAVRELYDRVDEQTEVAAFDHRLLALLPGDDRRRIDLFRQLGELNMGVLEDEGQAIWAWTQLLALEPYDPQAIGCLEDLYQQSESWDACVQILERKVEITEDAYDKVSILFRAAEMYEEQLGDAVGAQQAYAKVVEVQPDNYDAYDNLERLYEAGEQWDVLVDLLLARLQVTGELADMLDIYERTAKVLEERLENIEGAFKVLSMAFEASLDDERFGAELARLAEMGNFWGPLIETYQRVIESLGEVPESVPLRIRVARWWDEKLQQAEYANTHYEYALAIDPDNVEALTARELLLERYEQWELVAGILQRKVELVQTDEESKASYEKLARILERHLDRPDEAIEAYRQVLLVDAADLPSLVALEGLYTVRLRWQELIDVLLNQAAVLEEPGQIVEKYLQVGELWETRLDSPERAIEAYRQALSVDDKCVEAMRALERLYAQLDQWTQLLDVFELMLQVTADDADRLRIYRQIAEIQESQVQDRYATVDAYRSMMEIAPGDPHAVQALDRLYRETEQWEELAEVYDKHLSAIQDPETVVLIRTALAEIHRGPLSDPQKAIDALTPILDILPDHTATLQTLSVLYAEVEDWNHAIDVISREANQIHDRGQQIDRQYQVGRIYQQKVGDLEQAERWFQNALQFDPNYLPALEALGEVYEARGQWTDAVRTLQMMEAATKVFAEKSKYLFAIGRIYEKHIDERTIAIDYYEQAMDMSPDNADAAEPLVDVYWTDENWARAEPLLDLMLQGKQDADIRELQQLNYRIGYCAEQLRKDEKALGHYRQAYELDSTHLPTLQGMGNLLFRHEDWDRAFKIYQTILVHHRDSLDEAQVVGIFHQQGQIKLKLGERRKALDFFRKALEIDPRNAEILKALIDLHEARNDWEDVIHYRRQVAGLIDDPVEKFEALVGIGDILSDQMNNTRLAVEAYNDALAVQPGSRLVLGKLIGLHEASENWAAMVDVLSQLAEQETNPQRKSKYWCGVATLQREKLRDNFIAVRSFDKGLEADPGNLRAFQAIDQILTEERDYERQDRYYRKMLKRATEVGLEDGLVFSLAKNLGEINRTRLERFGEAIKAYKIALTKKPDDAGTHGILAELYEREDQIDKAIAQHYTLINLNPRSVESYQELRRLFMDVGKYDEAWCVCQVLVFLNQASQDERLFYEKYRSRTLKQAQRQLDQRHWGLIFHPEKSPLLDHLFQQLFQFTLPVVAKNHKQLGLHKRKTVLNPDEQTPFNSVMKYVSHTTRLPTPEAHRDPHNRPGLRLVELNPPAMLVGPDMVSGRKPQELAFAGAKQLFLSGQSNFLTNLGESYDQRKLWLTTIVYTLMKLVKPDANVQYDPNLFEQWAKLIPVPARAEMAKLIQKASANPKVHLNISKWLETVEHTGNRLGLVMANDLGAAVQVIKNEAGSFSRAPVQDRIRELVLFALSENYFKLRQALGLAIGSAR